MGPAFTPGAVLLEKGKGKQIPLGGGEKEKKSRSLYENENTL